MPSNKEKSPPLNIICDIHYTRIMMGFQLQL